MKCKKQMEMKDCSAKEIKKNTWAVTGVCVLCGTKMFKIVGKNKPIIEN
jgi:Zn finger protein HypA/HybF involved in hydrogenase expression